jgi:hypothetical protein
LATSGLIEYRCHLLDKYGQIVWRYKFLRSNDDEAITAARALLRQRITSVCGFELWQDSRYLHCENDRVVVDLWEIQAVQTPLPRQLIIRMARTLTGHSRYV